MNAKTVLVLCASALLVQSAVSQCLRRLGGGLGRCGGCGYGGLSYGGYGGRCGYGIGDIGLAGGLGASYGGGFGIASASAVPPVGLGVISENAYEGCVGVCGYLPFLGTAAVEGVFPSAGAGVINYGCGDGAVGITAEDGYGAGLGYGAGYGLGLDGYGLGYGSYGGCGCGCGTF